MDKPSIAILLAVYEPCGTWLEELLISLNAQTYPALRLYVRDDASPSYSRDRLEALLKKYITRFSYSLTQNETNLGSNATFEALLKEASEPYIAFCDQDDVWNEDKLQRSMELLRSSPLSPVLVCSNVSVIDQDGKQIAPTIERHRKRHTFLRGNGLAPQLLYRNFVIGCTLLMERERAVHYLPFPKVPVHDHYLAFRAALDGAIDYVEDPLLRYRVYGGNQTGVMTKVKTKEDYRRERIEVFCERIQCLSSRASFEELSLALAWGEARRNNFDRKKGAMRALWRLRRVNPATTLFELVALRLPKPLFALAIRMIQKGIL